MHLISNIPARCRCIDCAPDLDAALVANPFAAQRFAAAAQSYRRNVLRWIKAVKTATTRDKRIAITVVHAVPGAKVAQI